MMPFGTQPLFHIQDGCTAAVCLPHSCVQKKSCLLTLIAKCRLYSPATSCLWYSIIILWTLQRKQKASPLFPLCSSTRIYFTSALASLISFHWPTVCLYSHIKVTFATLFPPKTKQTPHPSLQSADQRESESGRAHISRRQYNTWHIEQFSLNNGNTIA